MSLVEGDCHGDLFKFSSDNFPRGKELTKDDYVIILGDMGVIWEEEASKDEKYWLDWLDAKPWTTLFIPGNHENFDRLEGVVEEFEWKKWHGGNVKVIRPSILYLPVGETYEIDGHTFLALGKAASHDIDDGIIDPADYETRDEMKAACRELEKRCGGWPFARYRIKYESWWPQEVPNIIERDAAIENLELIGNKVDFILTHEAPASMVAILSGGYYKPTEYSFWLENEIKNRIPYGWWYGGHYHIDNEYTSEKYTCLFNNIIQIA